MNPLRRALLLAALAGPQVAAAAARTPDDDPVRRGRPIAFPRDHGAHPGVRTEWWYATGWLGTPDAPAAGFQLTFFRSSTGLAQDNRSRFAARQLLFAHAALTQLTQVKQLAPQRATHLHDQRIARWSGDAQAGHAHAQVGDGQVRIGSWQLRRQDGRWSARIPARGFALDLSLQATQPPLLQGDGGFSRKGPVESQASHYYSEPQLAATTADGQVGRAWLDHEWSEQILHPQAVGWDWIGINLFDGSALTAFVLRRRDGSTLWAGGSWRAAGASVQSFAPDQVAFTAGRIWQSPGSGARYPVQWQVRTPAGAFEVRSLLDAQELDSRGSTGTIYWEGLSELVDAQGRRVGLGYLEMTGYAAPIRLA